MAKNDATAKVENDVWKEITSPIVEFTDPETKNTRYFYMSFSAIVQQIARAFIDEKKEG